MRLLFPPLLYNEHVLNRIRNLFSFFGTLAWRSVSDTGVYLRAALLPGRLLITYTLLASLLLALGHTVRFWYQDVPSLRTQAESIWQELAQNWPDDLVLQYQNGAWEMMPPEAVQVPYPSAFPRPEGWPQYLATLLPVEPNTISAQIPSLLAAGPETFFIRSGERIPQPVAWRDVLEPNQSFTLSAETIAATTPHTGAWLTLALQQLTLGVFLWRFLGVWLLRLAGLLLYAWLAQVFWTFRGRNLKYSTVYKMGLLILPLAETILLIWKSFWTQMAAPLSFWWIWLLIMFVIVLSAPRKIR